jgi:arsenate reductase (glutaredoxin)
MPAITIYHNPRCSKSRQALQLLQDNHLEPEVIEYLKNPPSAKEMTEILKSLNLHPRDLMRKQEEIYKTLQLDNPKLTNQQLITALVTYPILIDRPIIIRQNKAIIARPPEKVLEIL